MQWALALPVKVYLLWHTHLFPCDDDEEPEEDVKLLGVYASAQAAEARIVQARELPGFCDVPDGFEVSEYTVGKDNWDRGYKTVWSPDNRQQEQSAS
jgi:hypothetical protein